jgi:phosphopantothenoylcysteine decarboxylase/phosphopantothenate--cysteine ligase
VSELSVSSLKGKKILLAVCGSIAAYKSAFLTRLLIKSGAEVRVLMTEASTSFISPLTLSTLSKNPVHASVSDEGSWNNHVEMGLWADAMVIAPATATTLGKLANGICDNIVVAAYLSARCPVFFAPAMDLDMWLHPATQHNVERLKSYGNQLIPVGEGELASGLVGKGRMAEPEEIVQYLGRFFDQSSGALTGVEMMITAGPTYEPIDPVRFIGNWSSGKMGVAIADAAARRGANVILILGPSPLSPKESTVKMIRVQTAEEMYEAANSRFENAQVAIMAAAVADYRPKEPAAQKIKKKDDELQLQLIKNPDIAASLGARKQGHQLLVGFALETNDAQRNAMDKLRRKNMDLIVLNSLQDKGAGFNHDTNKVSFLSKDNKIRNFELKSKAAVAEDILDELTALIKNTI